MLVWVIVEREEYQDKIKNLSKVDTVTFSGVLYHEIPFYTNTTELAIEIKIDFNGPASDKPKVVSILRINPFQVDFENGINLVNFKSMLTKLYHLE